MTKVAKRAVEKLLTIDEAKLLIDMLTQETTRRLNELGVDNERYRDAAKLLAKLEEHYIN